MIRSRVLSPHRVVLGFMAFLAIGLSAPRLDAAQPVATMVADIGQRVPVLTSDAFLPPLPAPVELDGVVYFQNDDGIHGRELWRSDGTTAGTRMVRDVCPGACGSVYIGSFLSTAATASAVYFAADDGVHGQELWVTDGTSNGTHMVRDLVPGWRSSQPGYFVATSQRLFFWAWDAQQSRHLWTSDGTLAGTVAVPTETPDWRGAGTALQDVMLFTASSSPGLWRSDGTAAGTYSLSSAYGPGQNFTANASFTLFGGRLVFLADDGDLEPPTLWVSDGTIPGTHALAPVEYARGFALVGDRLYYFAKTSFDQWSVWSVDAALESFEEIVLPTGLRPANYWGRAVEFGGELYFTAFDALHGEELWRIRAGLPELFFEVYPGSDSGFPLDIDSFWPGIGPFLAALPDRLLFFADDGVHGLELWATDGTAGGTGLVRDLTPGPEGTRLEYWTSPLPPTVLDGRLLFRTRSFVAGVDLWSSDGTADGTVRLRSLRAAKSAISAPELGASFYGAQAITCFAPVGAGMLFAADDGSLGVEPWYSAIGEGGAHLVADLADGSMWSSPEICAPIGGRAVFGADTTDPAYSVRLISTSGQAGDVVDVAAEPLYGHLYSSAHFGGRLLLGAYELWATDGSISGTEKLEPEGAGFLEQLLPLGNQLLAGGSELAATDGSPGGLTLIEPPGLDGSLYPLRLTRLGESALFLGWQPAQGQELWKTDGTPENTVLVRDIRPGPETAFPEEYPGARALLTRIVPLGARAFFAADDGVHGEELWVTDGSAAGTELFADIVPGPYPSVPRELVRVGDWLFFTAESVAAGRELWVTKGGASGITLLFDLLSGAGSSVPQELTAIGTDLYFTAWTARDGREPWRLPVGPGGPGVPSRIADLAPGPLSSSPLVIRNVGADVYTVANDNVHGFELWTLRDPDVLFADDFESSGLALWAGTPP